MSRKFSISLLIMQCIIAHVCAAGTGHTGNNGGGLGEIGFTDVWKTLDQIMAPCLNSSNPCGLKSGQSDVLRAAIQNRPATNADYKSSDFYSASGSALSRAELTVLALTSVLKCEAQLVGMDVQQLVKTALNFKYYRVFGNGQAVSLFGSEALNLISPDGSSQDLTKILLQKVKTTPGFEVQIAAVSSGLDANGVEINGVALLDPTARVHFQFQINASGVELLVYP
ncbi:MAG: hypothetical protein ACXWQE_11090 [Bdellovibrionales bacterium]